MTIEAEPGVCYWKPGRGSDKRVRSTRELVKDRVLVDLDRAGDVVGAEFLVDVTDVTDEDRHTVWDAYPGLGWIWVWDCTFVTASPQDAPSGDSLPSSAALHAVSGTSRPPDDFNPSERLWAFLEELTSEVVGLRAQLALVGTGVDRLGEHLLDGLERRAEG